MNRETIQQLVQELEALPDADQQRVLNFLAKLKRHRGTTGPRHAAQASNPALVVKDGLLVFTGEVEAPGADWVQLVRDERDEELMATATGETPRQ